MRVSCNAGPRYYDGISAHQGVERVSACTVASLDGHFARPPFVRFCLLPSLVVGVMLRYRREQHVYHQYLTCVLRPDGPLHA